MTSEKFSDWLLESPLSTLSDHSRSSISLEFSMSLISLPAETAKRARVERTGRRRKVVR